MKKILKKIILKTTKNLILDSTSNINYNVSSRTNSKKYPTRIFKSECNITSIGEGCQLYEVHCYGDVNIGRFVSITGPGTVLKSLVSKINVGSFTSIGQNVCIVDFNHNIDRASNIFYNYIFHEMNFDSDLKSNGEVNIGEDVWIGSNTVILPGVTVGRGAVIGAGSVVTKNVSKYSIAIGNPAREIKRRFNEDVAQYLEKTKWWEWDTEKIVKNKEFFQTKMNKA